MQQTEVPFRVAIVVAALLPAAYALLQAGTANSVPSAAATASATVTNRSSGAIYPGLAPSQAPTAAGCDRGGTPIANLPQAAQSPRATDC